MSNRAKTPAQRNEDIVISDGTVLEGVRIADMPDLGAVTDGASFVGELAGSGRFSAIALKNYMGAAGVGGGVPEAPKDGTYYGRGNTSWARVLPLTGGSMQGQLTLYADPTANLGAATKQYVDAHALGQAPADGSVYGRQNNAWAKALPLAGGTTTGAITLPGDPVAPLQAATKAYVDSHSGSGGLIDAPADGTFYGRENNAWINGLALSGGTMAGSLTLASDPTANMQAATKQYVDAHAGGGIVSFEINVKDAAYGAKGDGSTNDTAAIQAALNAVPSGGARVVFPHGNYIVTGTLTIATPGASLCGVGQYASTITIPNHTFNLFNITAVGSVEIQDLGVTAQATGSSECYVVNCNTAYDIRLHRLLFIGIFSGIFTGGSFFHADNIQMINIKPTSGRGVVINQTSGELNELDHVVCQNGPGNDARAGVYCTQVNCLQMTDCQLIKMGNALWVVGQSSGTSPLSIKCIGCWFDTSVGSGVVLDGTAREIDRVDFTSCWFGSCAYGLYITGVVRGLRIMGSQIVLNKNSGIVVLTNSTVTGMIVSHNEIAGNTSYGIDMGGGVSDFILSHNVVGPSSDFPQNGSGGILVRAGDGDGFIISHNNMIAQTAPLNNGSGTSIIVEKNLGVVNTIGRQVGSSSALTLSSGGTTNVAAISVGPGTWRVTGELWLGVSGGAFSIVNAGINSGASNIQNDPTSSGSRTTICATLNAPSQVIPISAAIILGPASVYLTTACYFTGTATAWGEIQAQPAN